MITKKDIPPEATITLKGTYRLSAKAFINAQMTGDSIGRTRQVSVTINTREAIRTGYAFIDYNGEVNHIGGSNGLLFRNKPVFGSPKALFCKKPSVTRICEFNPPEFDHILTEKEATDFVVNEMNRFDEVLAAAEAMSQRDMIGEGEVCRWCHAELPAKARKPSDCPRCAKRHNESQVVMKGSEECLKCEAGITYGPARLSMCFACVHVLKANPFSDQTTVRCPRCKKQFSAQTDLPRMFSVKCDECETTFEVTAVLLYHSPTIFEKTELQAK